MWVVPEGEKLLPAVSLCSDQTMTAEGRAKFNHKPALRNGPIRWLVLSGGLLIAAIAIGTAVMGAISASGR